MIQKDNIWFPDAGAKAFGNRPSKYQMSKYLQAKKYIKNWRCVIDVGAHVGIWSRFMSPDFHRVIAFEPIPENVECLRKNAPGVAVFELPLSDKLGTAKISNPKPENTGAWEISDEGMATRTHMLDNFYINDIDFIKIDVQGHELQVLKGAEKTIRKHRPVLVVEDLAEKTVEFMNGLGYDVIEKRGKDILYVKPDVR